MLAQVKFALVFIFFSSFQAVGYGQSIEEIDDMSVKDARSNLKLKVQEVKNLKNNLDSCEQVISELETCKQGKISLERQIRDLQEENLLLTGYAQVNGVYWTKSSLQITELKNGKSLQEARDIDEWILMTDDKVPCYMRPTYKKSEEPGFLYNIHAVQIMDQWKGTEGLRLPTVEEGNSLVNYLNKISNGAANAGMLLRLDNSLNVKSGGYCYKDSNWEPLKTIFWLSPKGEGVKGLSIGSDNSIGIFERTSNNYGFMVRLVKK
jgi:hypothetical protein